MPAGPARRARRAAIGPVDLSDEEHRAAAVVARGFGWWARSTPWADLADLRQEAALGLVRWRARHPGGRLDFAAACFLGRRAICDLIRSARRPESELAEAPACEDPAPSLRLDVAEALDRLSPTTRLHAERIAAGGMPRRTRPAARRFAERAARQLRDALDVYADDYRPRKSRLSDWHRRGRVRDGRAREAGPTRGDVARALETLED